MSEERIRTDNKVCINGGKYFIVLCMNKLEHLDYHFLLNDKDYTKGKAC